MRQSKYRLLVFDWDGTLMDSVDRIVASIGAAIDEIDAQPRAPERIRNIIGLGLAEAVNRLYPGADSAFVEQLSQLYRQQFLVHCTTPSRLYDASMQVLQDLHADGYLLAVATGKGVRGLRKDLQDTATAHLFRATRTAEETRSKPHPQMLHELLAELAVEAGDVLMIGDTEYDLLMAAAAGVDAVGISGGVHAAERLQRHAPRAVLASIGELPAYLNQA